MAEARSQLALDRRATLALLALGGAALASCGSRARAAACLASASETRGPFAADGGRDAGGRLNILETEGIIRSDVRGSFAGLDGVADGVPLDLEIEVVGVAGACNRMADWAVYLWQNDAAGAYSLYNLPRANYLRGLQQSDAEGIVRFQTILPGCYGGRAPHIHFEVFSSAQAAVSGEPAVLASQFAFAENACREVYAADPRYGGSLANLERWNNERDFVFGDAEGDMRELQTIALEGNASGFRGRARVGINY